MQSPIIDQDLQIEKADRKDGWRYVVVSGISAEYRDKQGLVRIRGFIDHYEIRQFNMLPLKDGRYLLPIKSTIRKKIRKQEGDWVKVVLYPDDTPVVVTDEIAVCLEESPQAQKYFESLSESNKKYYIDWVESAQKLETKANRMLKMIQNLEAGRHFYDWPKKEED